MTDKDVLPERELLEKAATMKRFEYSPLGKELKAQTDIAKKQYQGLDKAFISNKNIKIVNEWLIKNIKNISEIFIYSRLSLYSYSDDKKFDRLPFKSKYSYLLIFYDELQNLFKMKPLNLGQIKEKVKNYNTASELCNKRFENYCNEYNELSDVKK